MNVNRLGFCQQIMEIRQVVNRLWEFGTLPPRAGRMRTVLSAGTTGYVQGFFPY